MRGLDISVWNHDKFPNGELPWSAIKAAGVDFVIIRTGAGRTIADDTFTKDVNDAHAWGMKVGAYHYSYAMSPSDAIKEAEFCKQIINNSGVFLELPVFFDMEDGDHYKVKTGFEFSCNNITEICKAWLDTIKPLKSGVYASLSWLEDYIDWKQLVQSYSIPIWNAQYSSRDDFKGWIWQFTDHLMISGKPWDANILYDDVHKTDLEPWSQFIQS